MIVSAYSTLREPPEIPFPHELQVARDRDDPKLVPHLGEIIGVACDRGRREMTPTLYGVMRHLERTRHHIEIEFDPQELSELAVWGWQSNAILFFPDHSIRDPAGRILVYAETGEAEGNATVPYPIDAIERAADTREALAAMHIETPRDLPPTVGEGEVVMRPDDEIGWRTLALFIVAVRAESLATGKPIATEVLRAKSPMAFEAMTPAELEFVHNDAPDQQTVINFAWRYEALYTLQWALGLHSELQPASDICDVPKVAETMVDRADRDIVTSAKLRPTKRILDAADMNLRLLWAARDAALNQRETPGGIDGGVLSERQHALNWLTQFGNQPWDDVDTPT